MKKKKTYEISVIDKTYSNTITDETKFYTSDTALELGFILKETEYDFESAEIVLLNIDDRSLVTRPVAKVLDSFAYELEDDITAHYGEWRGQLRFEQAGEIYVSSPVKFRIENDLSNERPPQLSDVQSWVNLKRYADGLVDELKQAVEEAVANVEAMDDTFKANELDRDKAERERQVRFEDAESEREKGESVRVETFQTNEANRQSQFETAEQSRQTTFETNESERDETFNTNETTRQTQELEREGAEATRQTVFDENEANRFETFNNNEATRQENETTRQQAETQRVTAESSRASAEEQRKIDHENRSAELDGKANKQQEDWITPTLWNEATGDLQFRKNDFGRVEFRGEVTSGITEGTSLFRLPIGYRNTSDIRIAVVSNDSVVSNILIRGGTFYRTAPLAGKTVSFNNLSIIVKEG